MTKNEDFFRDNLQDKILFFTKWVDGLHDGGLTYLEAIADFCETHDIEYDDSAKLITETMKQKIYEEAISLNLIKGSKSVLTY